MACHPHLSEGKLGDETQISREELPGVVKELAMGQINAARDERTRKGIGFRSPEIEILGIVEEIGCSGEQDRSGQIASNFVEAGCVGH